MSDLCVLDTVFLNKNVYFRSCVLVIHRVSTMFTILVTMYFHVFCVNFLGMGFRTSGGLIQQLLLDRPSCWILYSYWVQMSL